MFSWMYLWRPVYYKYDVKDQNWEWVLLSTYLFIYLYLHIKKKVEGIWNKPKCSNLEEMSFWLNNLRRKYYKGCEVQKQLCQNRQI